MPRRLRQRRKSFVNASPRPLRPTRRTNLNPRTELVVVGRLGAPFGVRGEIKCRPARFGPEAFATGRSFRVGDASSGETLVCSSVRTHQDTLLVRFEGIDSPESARALTNRNLFAAAAEMPLADGEYLDRDLIGCELVDPLGVPLGRVIDVHHFPAQDCLVVGPARAYVPLIGAFIRTIDIASKTIGVELPEGLLEP